MVPQFGISCKINKPLANTSFRVILIQKQLTICYASLYLPLFDLQRFSDFSGIKGFNSDISALYYFMYIAVRLKKTTTFKPANPTSRWDPLSPHLIFTHKAVHGKLLSRFCKDAFKADVEEYVQ